MKPREVLNNARGDLATLGIPARSHFVAWAILSRPGLRAVMLFRLQELCESMGQRFLAVLVSNMNQALTGAEILVGARFGPGLDVRHPSGVVVGHRVRAGGNCILMQHVTLGERHVDGSGDHQYPVLGDRVTVGVGASVLGGVVIGNDAQIGAHAVVLHDVPPATTVAGVPAKPIRRSEQRPSTRKTEQN